MLSQAHLYIKGDVIGVGFRAWARIHARQLDIHGWIRDAHDKEDIFGKSGGVETVLQGEHQNVEQFIELIRKGPSISMVHDVEVFWQDVKDIYEEFEIRK